jgi:hypothetical protein
MNFAINWVLGLFKKPQIEVTFDKANITTWPFPVPKAKRKPTVKKATTRKPAVKKTAVKKVTKVVKKAK